MVIQIASIISKIAIHIICQAQIVLLKAKKAPIIIPEEYLDYANVFSEKLATMLLEYSEINIHAINLKKGKQPLYRPIYSLKPMKLEILKTYIKTNLVNGFIRPFKSSASAFILYD